jgi:hypothetical protein
MWILPARMCGMAPVCIDAIRKQEGTYGEFGKHSLQWEESDATNKHFGREMMKHAAEQHKALAKEQFSSHKEMSSAMAALGKVLCFDLWRQMHSLGWIICNDAKSCYDRILHSPAMMAMMRMGLPYSVVGHLMNVLT